MTPEYDVALMAIGRALVAQAYARELSRGESCIVLMSRLMVAGWRFRLDGDRLHATIGDAVPHLSVTETLAILGQLAPECEFALSGLVNFGTIADFHGGLADRVQ